MVITRVRRLLARAIKQPVVRAHFRLFGARGRYEMLSPQRCLSLRPLACSHLKYQFAFCNADLLAEEDGSLLAIGSDQAFTISPLRMWLREMSVANHNPAEKSLLALRVGPSWKLQEFVSLRTEVDGQAASPSQSIGDVRLFHFQGKPWAYASGWSHSRTAWPLLGPLQGDLLRLRRLHYDVQPPQKNWMPFESDGRLLLEYAICPHTIVECDPETMLCTKVSSVEPPVSLPPSLQIHGGTPALRLDESTFLGCANTQEYSWFQDRYYGMVLYMFRASPPYEPTHATPLLRVGSTLERVRYTTGMLRLSHPSTLTFSLGVNDWDNHIAEIPFPAELFRPIGKGETPLG